MLNRIEVWRPRGSSHTVNILVFKYIFNASYVWLSIIVNKHEVRVFSTPVQPHIGLKGFIPLAMCVYSTRIEDVQWCMTAKHYAAPDKNSFSTKYLDLFYEKEVIESPRSLQMKIRRELYCVVNLD